MAVCLRNIGTTPLRIDLSNGESLLLKPGADSPPLREEQLYFNTYLAEWERLGWLVRVPVKMAEVLKHEKSQREAAPRGLAPAAGGPPVRVAAPATDPAEAAEEEESDPDEEDAEVDAEAEPESRSHEADADDGIDVEMDIGESAPPKARGKATKKRGTSRRKK